MTLAALLDPAGHPARVWASDAVTEYLTAYRSYAGPGSGAGSRAVTAAQARAVVLVLIGSAWRPSMRKSARARSACTP